jgi:hypothetical protein
MKIEPVRMFSATDSWGEFPSEVTADGRTDAYVHLVGVTVNAGGAITTIDRTGTHLSEGAAAGRGVNVRIEFQSEDGEQFDLVMQFHKGCTYARTERLTDLIALSGDDAADWTEWRGAIWRD